MKGVDRRKQRKKQVYWVFNPFRWRTFEKNDKYFWEKILSEVGFEPTPTEVDCDLNAAP